MSMYQQELEVQAACAKLNEWALRDYSSSRGTLST